MVQDETERREAKKLTTRIQKRPSKNRRPRRGSTSPSTRRSNEGLSPISPRASSSRRESMSSSMACVGVGKTHLAEALGHEACRRGYRVLFVKAVKMRGTSSHQEPISPGGGRSRSTFTPIFSSSMASASLRSRRSRPRTSTRSSRSATCGRRSSSRATGRPRTGWVSQSRHGKLGARPPCLPCPSYHDR